MSRRLMFSLQAIRVPSKQNGWPAAEERHSEKIVPFGFISYDCCSLCKPSAH